MMPELHVLILSAFFSRTNFYTCSYIIVECSLELDLSCWLDLTTFCNIWKFDNSKGQISKNSYVKKGFVPYMFLNNILILVNMEPLAV